MRILILVTMILATINLGAQEVAPVEETLTESEIDTIGASAKEEIEAIVSVNHKESEGEPPIPQGPPPPASLTKSVIWWGDLSVSIPIVDFHISQPLPFGYIGLIKNPDVKNREIDPATGKVKNGWFAILRLSPFGLEPFRKQLEDQGGGFFRGMRQQMNMIAQLADPKAPPVNSDQVKETVKTLFDGKFTTTENLNAINRELAVGACKDALCVVLGKIDSPASLPFFPTRNQQSSESLMLKWATKNKGPQEGSLALTFRTFTFRGGLNEQGLPQAYISNILNPPATRRNGDGSLEAPKAQPLFNFKFDSYEASAQVRPSQKSILSLLGIREINAAAGKARGERFAVANLTAGLKSTNLFFQFGAENFMKNRLGDQKNPNLKRFAVTSWTPFRQGRADFSAGYSQISSSGTGPGVPSSSKFFSATSSQQISGKIGPGHLYIREFFGVLRQQGKTTPILTNSIGFKW